MKKCRKGAIYNKALWNDKNLRVMRVDNYLVFYTTDTNNKMVTVIRIMYGKRNIEWLLSQEE